VKRRSVLGAGAAALALAACDDAPASWQGGWLGASFARGHRLRSGAAPAADVQRRAGVLIVGAGIAGLSAARGFALAGIDDVQLLELEDDAGGNSRGHVLAGQRCPLGAHYLPVPGTAAHEVADWLHEIGLLRQRLGRSVADERYLCHSPQERLFFDGAWREGFLPPAAPGSTTLTQYRRFAAAVVAAQTLGFSVPTTASAWTPALAALDAQSFAAWLARAGLDDRRLLWYLDYCCRDDYGAGLASVSAWAGLHYFASRHGFHAPGDETAEREPVFTWPEGNAWLAARLAAPFKDRLHTGRTVLRVSEGRHEVSVLAWDEAAARAEQWTAARVVLALPLFVAARVLERPPAALREAAASQRHAPWLVGNLHLKAAPLPRPGLPLAWDNVEYGSGSSGSLGYVDAGHQRLNPAPGPVVLTSYHALPVARRGALLADSWATWAGRIVGDLSLLHPDLRSKVERIDLMRYGHAMAIPAPGQRGSAALAALRAMRGRVRFAHADLAAYSVFEEAFSAGLAAARDA